MDKIHDKFTARREELFAPIHQQILMTDDVNDLQLLAINMLTTSIHIFMEHNGIDDARQIIQEVTDMAVDLRQKGSTAK